MKMTKVREFVRRSDHELRASAYRLNRREWPFLAYIIISLAVTLSLGQYYQESGGLIYWLLTLPLAFLPLLRSSAMVSSALGRAFPVVVFVVIGGGWHFLHGDMTAASRAVLLGWGLIWVVCSSARIRIDDVYILYASAVLVGALIWLFGDLNYWGLLPGTTTAVGETSWRVSFFPNVAYTGFFSFIVLAIGLRDPRPKSKRVVILLSVAAYFMVFSFVRTALVGLVVFVALRQILEGRKSTQALFWIPLVSTILVNAAITYSPVVLEGIQSNPIISRLFLRGETNESQLEIYQQLYRPYVWGQHIHQFFTSPNFMGWGSIDFNRLKTFALVEGREQGGSISLPTRLLAEYGLAGLLLVGYLVSRLYVLAKRRDIWGCACFPSICLAMLHWGTMFHPTDAMFGLMLLVLMRGSAGFRHKLVQAPPTQRERIG